MKEFFRDKKHVRAGLHDIKFCGTRFRYDMDTNLVSDTAGGNVRPARLLLDYGSAEFKNVLFRVCSTSAFDRELAESWRRCSQNSAAHCRNPAYSDLMQCCGTSIDKNYAEAVMYKAYEIEHHRTHPICVFAVDSDSLGPLTYCAGEKVAVEGDDMSEVVDSILGRPASSACVIVEAVFKLMCRNYVSLCYKKQPAKSECN